MAISMNPEKAVIEVGRDVVFAHILMTISRKMTTI